MIEVTSLKSLLNNYQRTVQQLLSLQACQGTSLQELERFRQEFRTSAFTCRLPSCPLSSDGFEDHHLRLAHEAIHRKIVCRVQGCQYPPFLSTRALKQHQKTCHNEVPESQRKDIRKAAQSMRRPIQNGQESPLPMPEKFTHNQLVQIVYERLAQQTQSFTGICWQAKVHIRDRIPKILNLYVCLLNCFLPCSWRGRKSSSLDSANCFQHLQNYSCYTLQRGHGAR